jgi:hypothetical protein
MGRPTLFKTRMTNAEKQRRDRQSLQPPRKKRRLAPGRNAPAHDLIMTPPALARAIVRHFRPEGRVLYPARGKGAFYSWLQRGWTGGLTMTSMV